ncbi:MAG: O-antigen ligase family protein [Acidiferrobacterales bacterium]
MIKALREQRLKVEYRMMMEKAHTVAKWSGAALGFSIPVSTALDSVLRVFVLAFWVLGASYRKKWELIRGNPVAMLSLGMFGLLILGGLYSNASWSEVFKFLVKYSDLVLLALLIPLFQDAQTRRNGLWAFFLTMGVTLLLSYLIGFGVLPGGGVFKGSANDASVFKSHITQSPLVALTAFAFATFARIADTRRRRMIWITLAAIAVHNVFFMVQGRTGYVIVGVLFVYFFVEWLGWKGFVVAIVGGTLLVVSAFFLSDVFHARFSRTEAEFSEWRSGQVVFRGVVKRIVFYQNSLAIVRDSPVFGVGTGGFAQTYAEKVKNSRFPPTSNPHNEYLLIAVQLGLVGLVGLLYLFYTQWRLAADLPGLFERNLARALLLTVMTTSLGSSALLDHSEGLFYAWMSALLFAGLNFRGEKIGKPPVPLFETAITK